MNKTLFLLWPWVRGIANSIHRGKKEDRLKSIFFFCLGLGFWIALFYGSLLFFGRLAQEEPFGHILIEKLISFVFMIFFAVLIFSNIVTALNTFFLSDDLYLVFSSPVPYERLYTARYIHTMVLSSWMVVMFALPVFIANGIVYHASWFYYPWMTVVLFAFLLLPCAVATMVTMILVKAFPARKIQDILIVIAIMFVVLLYFLFRFLQPEQLFNQDVFHGFTEFFATMQTPDSPWLPTTWANMALNSGTSIDAIAKDGTFYLLMMLSNGLLAVILGGMISEKIYFDAYSKSQEGRNARFTRSKTASGMFNFVIRSPHAKRRQLMLKDTKTFFRETTQWTQLLLLGSLVVVYLFNYKVLHLDRYAGITFLLRNIIAYLNIVLAGFVMSAISVRFVLPAVSIEGKAFWILRTAPIRMRDFLWTKYLFYLVPIFIIAEILIVVSNIFLKTSTFLSVLSAFVMAMISLGIVSLAVGIGAMFPNFEEKNVPRMSTGASAIIYMVIAVAYVLALVFLAAAPAKIWQIHLLNNTMPNAVEWGITLLSALIAILVIAAAVILPIRRGIQSLENMEG